MVYDGTLEGEFEVWAKFDALTNEDLMEAILEAREDAQEAQFMRDYETLFNKRMDVFVGVTTFRHRGLTGKDMQEYVSRTRMGDENDG